MNFCSVLSYIWYFTSYNHTSNNTNKPIEPDKDEPDKDEPDKDEPDKDEPDKDEQKRKYASASLIFHIVGKGYLLCNENRSTRKNGPKNTPMVNTIGGKVEPEDESILDTAIREFEEETGILIRKDKSLISYKVEHFDFCCSVPKQLYHRFHVVPIDPDCMPEIHEAVSIFDLTLGCSATGESDLSPKDLIRSKTDHALWVAMQPWSLNKQSSLVTKHSTVNGLLWVRNIYQLSGDQYTHLVKVFFDGEYKRSITDIIL